jgi:hypothetical protein
MTGNSWNLEKAKQFIKNFVGERTDYYMIVTNKETEQEGCAIITKDKKVAVFEGKDDGSEDRVYSQKEFKEKYKIENIYVDYGAVTIEDIEMSICDRDLDTEYREALAKSLVELKYISDTPLNLKFGTEKQQKELERVWKKPLKAKQITEIINNIMNEMKGDFQYGRFLKLASYYLDTAKELQKREEKKVKRAMEAR